jgi:hypothetical protein
MASWCIVQCNSFRVKSEGKGLVERKVDPQNPLKSLEELETKSGVSCPEDRKKELLNKLHSNPSSTTLPLWLHSVTLPEWYNDASPSDVTNALQWGSDIVQRQKHFSEDKLHDQLNLGWKKILDSTLEDMEKQAVQLKEELARKDKEIQTWQAAAVANLSASGIDDKIQAVKQECADDKRLVMSLMERDLHKQTQQLERLQLEVTKAKECEEILRNKLEQRTTQEGMMNKSVIKGDAGEEMVDTWLRTAFFGSTIEDTSNETGKMDRHVYWDGLKIVVDSKNHEGRLHSKHDVKKFHDNFREMPDAHVAILLCTRSNVPCHNKFWVETEIINENQVAVYMNNVSANPIERLQLIAGTVIQPWKEYLQLRRKMSALLEGDELKTWTDKARTTLMNGWVLIGKLQESWGKTHTAINTSLKDFQDLLTQVAQDMRTNLAGLGIEMEQPVQAKKSRSKKA